jgi:hypothetical protein
VEHYACAVAAFEALDDGHKTWTASGPIGSIAPDGANHLFAIAIEVALKAFLRQRGLGVYDLKIQFGHDLIKLFDRAESEGLAGLEASDRALLALLNDFFVSREFEFIVTGSRQFPTFGALRPIACQIFDDVFDAIPSSRNFLNGKVGAYLERDLNNRK